MIRSIFPIIVMVCGIIFSSCASSPGAASRVKNAGLRPCDVRDVLDTYCDPTRQAKTTEPTSKY